MTPLTGNPFDNPEFRAELSAMFDDKLGDLREQVASHERVIQQTRGARWLLGSIWAVIFVVAEYFFHRK